MKGFATDWRARHGRDNPRLITRKGTCASTDSRQFAGLSAALWVRGALVRSNTCAGEVMYVVLFCWSWRSRSSDPLVYAGNRSEQDDFFGIVTLAIPGVLTRSRA